MAYTEPVLTTRIPLDESKRLGNRELPERVFLAGIHPLGDGIDGSLAERKDGITAVELRRIYLVGDA